MPRFYFQILVIPQAMGIEVLMKPNFGPLPNPIRTIQDVESNRSRCSRNFRLRFLPIDKGNVDDEVPLIGLLVHRGQLCVML
jgi:uroporphyrinogen decarboxylase